MDYTVSLDNVILKGIVGSQAYGMAHADSDVDYLGVFAHSTYALTSLHPPKLTIDHHEPDDVVLHEAGKFARLAMGCNPSLLDLLWLDEYQIKTDLGRQLVDIREAFLSARRVKDAYLGYATQQFKRITMRGDNSFSSDTKRRTAKHARHLLRLCETGYQLYSMGRMRLRVHDPQALFDFGERVAAGELHVASAMLSDYAAMFKGTASVLPKHPAESVIERWLLSVRMQNCR